MSRFSPGDTVRIANQAARVGSIAGGKYGTVAHMNRDTALVAVKGHGARLVVDLADLEPVPASPAPPDVLAVMDRLVALRAGFLPTKGADLCGKIEPDLENPITKALIERHAEAVEAYAAVAELVAAARDGLAEVNHYAPSGAALGGPFADATREKLRAALAKFGGAK